MDSERVDTQTQTRTETDNRQTQYIDKERLRQ